MEQAGSGSQWTIGELAEACGVSVRALHHYDEIGLLRASRRTASGHRRYTEQDVRRLYRIRGLQMLGLQLAEVGSTLESPVDDLMSLRTLLENQLAHVRRQADQLKELEGRIGQMLTRLDGPAMPAPELFMSTLEMIAMLENHFTPEQRQELAARRAVLGADKIEDAKRRWVGLMEEGLGYVRDQTPVSDPAVRSWARAWDEIGSMFHSGEQTKAAARSMWQKEAPALSENLPWSATDLAGLMDYLAKVRHHRAAAE
ncbi:MULTISPECIES: MerR family transcriptional regulator [Arthrobacter]|uniref:MerR family transcriptional regulator n=1 Tax=Arthrobacter terricola TaxID=2547396 RepID=A0A4R5KDV2_9MICC|nr:MULTISPECIES: MerR family transcriptional regulator [Arthrobacter]MBT8162328.1 MerR family transcriptional regulator [Arthrobacter sp. GN70]TDF93413.1 MerR family transcriptional regulator [Arthrobacter terricola]